MAFAAMCMFVTEVKGQNMMTVRKMNGEEVSFAISDVEKVYWEEKSENPFDSISLPDFVKRSA